MEPFSSCVCLADLQYVARVLARYARYRPPLDEVSRGALNLGLPVAEPVPWYLAGAQRDPDEPGDTPDGNDSTTPEGALWLALCTAPDEGADIAELMRLSGMTRPTLYRHLAAHAQAGRAIQVSRGRWRATTTEDELRPFVSPTCLISRLARVCT